jgi:hypothetical protein
MRLEKAARIRYGRFFYRFPNGESAADVYDRITGKFISVGTFLPEEKLVSVKAKPSVWIIKIIVSL